jgi:uncharacterized protein (DUF697 family)
MQVENQETTGKKEADQAIAEAIKTAIATAKLMTEAVQSTTERVTQSAATVGNSIGLQSHQWIEQATETIGRVVTPIAENPFIKFATKVPGINWLLAALGQVNVEQVEREIEQLRQQYPLETSQQVAHRVIVDTAFKAGGIGLLTNFVPPIALTLLAVDLAAITALQAEMIYRIATIYGFPPNEPARRGEVLAIFGLSMGGSGVLKGGLSVVEVLPVIGAAVGASSDAALLYSLGYLACQYYETKKNSQSTQ